MSGFTAIVLFFLVATVVGFLAIGRYHPKSGAEVLDWKPTRSVEQEVELELDDVDQMLEAQNDRRRRSGRAELTEDDINAQVDEERRAQRERSERYNRGPGG
jgi:hypothetical protein